MVLPTILYLLNLKNFHIIVHWSLCHGNNKKLVLLHNNNKNRKKEKYWSFTISVNWGLVSKKRKRSLHFWECAHVFANDCKHDLICTTSDGKNSEISVQQHYSFFASIIAVLCHRKMSSEHFRHRRPNILKKLFKFFYTWLNVIETKKIWSCNEIEMCVVIELHPMLQTCKMTGVVMTNAHKYLPLWQKVSPFFNYSASKNMGHHVLCISKKQIINEKMTIAVFLMSNIIRAYCNI